MQITDPRIGGLFAARNIFIGSLVLFGCYLACFPVTPAQAGLTGFLAGSMVWLKLISQRQLKGIRIERGHQARVFEGGTVAVSLRVTRGRGLPVQMLELEDQFIASLDLRQHHLVPLLTRGWEVMLHYERKADRHRGLYPIGPVRLRAGDPLGVFFEERELSCLTTLTVYPQTEPLPGYRVPGPVAAAGPSLDSVSQVGLGEEVLGVREYQRGDSPSRIHWRTSARRGRLHVMQLNRTIQAELAVMIDLTRRARLGLGAEATTELAIRAAIRILTCGHEARHRLSLAYAHEKPVLMPAGSGLAHLHLLLDRLTVLSPAGETDFWEFCGPRARMLAPGSRAVFIVAALNAPVEITCALVRRLTLAGIGVDFVLIDEREFIKIYHDQEVNIRRPPVNHALLAEALRQAGARVYPLSRQHTQLDAPAPAVSPARNGAGQAARFAANKIFFC